MLRVGEKRCRMGHEDKPREDLLKEFVSIGELIGDPLDSASRTGRPGPLVVGTVKAQVRGFCEQDPTYASYRPSTQRSCLSRLSLLKAVVDRLD